MWKSFFGFKKTPFGDSPDAKRLFASAAWQQVKTRLEFLTAHPGAGLLTRRGGRRQVHRRARVHRLAAPQPL